MTSSDFEAGRREIWAGSVIKPNFRSTRLDTVKIMRAGLITDFLLHQKIFEGRWFIFLIGGVCLLLVFVSLVAIRRRSKSASGKRRSTKNDRIALKQGYAHERNQTDENYELITERIMGTANKYKVILFAGSGLPSLPVTIPVNVAIQLAENKKRCLLIDLDVKRDAVAKVFEIDGRQSLDEVSPKASKTSFDNLWIWPAHNFTKIKQMNIKPLVRNAGEKFDLILLNAPCITASPDQKQIISAVEAAFVFSRNAAEATKLSDIVRAMDCVLIGNIQVREKNEK